MVVGGIDNFSCDDRRLVASGIHVVEDSTVVVTEDKWLAIIIAQFSILISEQFCPFANDNW